MKKKKEDGVDWESFGIEPPLCRFPYEKVENKMTFEIKAMIVDHLEARCHAHRIPGLFSFFSFFFFLSFSFFFAAFIAFVCFLFQFFDNFFFLLQH